MSEQKVIFITAFILCVALVSVVMFTVYVIGYRMGQGDEAPRFAALLGEKK